MAKLQIMDRTGHSTVEFDKANVVSVEEAQRRFDELTAQGFTAARRTGQGTSEVIRSFDRTADEIIMIPQLMGG